MQTNRREFIQTGVAVLLALGIKVPAALASDPLDLSRFCDDESGRYSLEAPFVHDGWIYATDGRILVRVPDTVPVLGIERNPMRRPPVEQLPEMTMFDGDGWRPWPAKCRCVDIFAWNDEAPEIQSVTSEIHISSDYDDLLRAIPGVEWKPGPAGKDHPFAQRHWAHCDPFSILIRWPGVQAVLCLLGNKRIAASLRRGIKPEKLA